MGKYTIGNACNITTGKLDANQAKLNGKYPFFTCAEFPDYIDEYAFDDDVVLIAGNNARGNFHVNRYSGKFNAYQRTYVLTAKENFDLDFIYYSLKLELKRLKERSQGSQTKFLTMPILNSIKLKELDLSTQQKIAQVLSTLDRKIALNQQINAELEKMAKTLYDYWFVQFDFPDENGNPYKSSGGEMVYNPELKRNVPKGWESVYLKDLILLSTGKEDANFATENGIYPFFTCSEQNLKCDIFSFDTQAILLAGNGSFSVKRYTGKFNAYQRTYILEPKQKELYPIIYFLVKSNVDSFISGSRGSIIKFITKGDIENIQIILPKNRNIDFTSILMDLFSQYENLEKENTKLTQLRDFLLPMLMNGQVEVG